MVTVLVCAYDAGKYLAPAIDSIVSQNYHNLEILVIDDGSKDGSIESLYSIQDPRIRIVRQNNQGKPAALNRGLREMSGEFYAVHDADDLSDPRRIKTQLKFLLDHPEFACVFCGYDIIRGDRHIAPRFRPKNKQECEVDIKACRMPGHDPTAMYRLSAVRGMEYDTTLYVGEGTDYILRVGEKFPMYVIGECLYSYRIHLTSITKQSTTRREMAVHEVAKRAYARRGKLDEFAATHTVPKHSHNTAADNNLAAHYIESVIDLREAGRWFDAIKTGVECSLIHPLDLHYHKALAYSIMPSWIRRLIRSRSQADSVVSDV